MGRTVFILGAGASVRAGCPVMANFLDVADQLRHSKPLVTPYAAAFNSVFDARAQLQSVHSKARLDVHNIESVFGAFEMARRFKKGFGRLKDEEVSGLSRSMRLLISRTLESTTRFGISGDAKIIPPHPYGNFASHVKRLKAKAGVAIITFNYDIGLDVALELGGLPIDYCLGENLVGGATVPVVKLHGSLNWGRCKTCNAVVPWPMAEFFRRFPLGGGQPGVPYEYLDGLAFIHVSSAMDACVHSCRPVLEKDSPVIIPPTWEKTNHDQGFENMWAHAANYLAKAENIVVVGYSLPPSDPFFPMLYALGTVSDTVFKRFWVFDPDPDGVVKERFKAMLGEAALQRFERHQLKFEDCNGYLQRLEADD